MVTNTEELALDVPESHEKAPEDFKRLFVRWNYANAKKGGDSRFLWHEAYAAQYPNGRISLDCRGGYDCLSDLKHALGVQGKYEIVWFD